MYMYIYMYMYMYIYIYIYIFPKTIQFNSTLALLQND